MGTGEQKAGDKVKQLSGALEEKEQALERLGREAAAAAAERATAEAERRVLLAGLVEVARAGVRDGAAGLEAQCEELRRVVEGACEEVRTREGVFWGQGCADGRGVVRGQVGRLEGAWRAWSGEMRREGAAMAAEAEGLRREVLRMEAVVRDGEEAMAGMLRELEAAGCRAGAAERERAGLAERVARLEEVARAGWGHVEGMVEGLEGRLGAVEERLGAAEAECEQVGHGYLRVL